jgi:hypothetical protein
MQAEWYSYLYEEPGRDERQAAVLAVEAVVVRIEGKVVQVEEPATRTPTIPKKTKN